MCGNVGPTYKDTTLAFAPGELKTAMAWTWNGSSPAPPYIKNDFQPANVSTSGILELSQTGNTDSSGCSGTTITIATLRNLLSFKMH